MERTKLSRLAQPSFLAAFAACGALAITAACGNNGSSDDNNPKIVSVISTSGPTGLQQAYYNPSSAGSSSVNVTIQDPSLNNIAITATADLAGDQVTAQSGVAGVYATQGVSQRSYLVQCTVVHDGTARVACELAWGTTALQGVRGYLFTVNSAAVFAQSNATGVTASYLSLPQVLQQLGTN